MAKADLKLRAAKNSLELQAKLFRGFADHSRLSILTSLRGGPLSVSEIVGITSLSQPNVSNHLRCLSACGLVASEQEGRFVHYRLNDPRIDKLLALANALLSSAVDDCPNYNPASPRGGRTR